MDSASQVILVLQVVLTVGPLAVYFLGLGLVSSQAHPCPVSERSDFILLTSAFVPVLFWPLVAVVTAGQYALAAVLVSVVTILFFMLLPQRDSGWVIYNISPVECHKALRRACQRLGWHVDLAPPPRDDHEMSVEPVDLHLSMTSMPWLRNVTLRCRPTANRAAREDLLRAFSAELRRESLLPSPTGAGLVVIGATMLGVPMYYFFHHMDSIVDVVRRFLLA